MIDSLKAHAVAEAYVEALRADDEDAWLSLFADQAVLQDPADAPALVGKAAIAGFWERTHASGVSEPAASNATAGMKMTPEVIRIVVCADEVLLLFRLVMRASDGTGVVLDTCDILGINEDGRIRSMKAYWDKSCLRKLEAGR